MTTIAEYYERTNALWPRPLPPLTYTEAVRAARKIYRYVMKRKCPWTFREATGRVGTWMGVDGFHINAAGDGPHPGWIGLVHSLSHYLHNKVNEDKPHSKSHARLEARIVKQVLKRGWLNGELRTAPKAAPAPIDKTAKKLAQIEAGIKRWGAKKRRAENALRKLVKSQRYYDQKRAALEMAAIEQRLAA